MVLSDFGKNDSALVSNNCQRSFIYEKNKKSCAGNSVNTDQVKVNALIHDLRNELTAALLFINFKDKVKEVPNDLAVLLREKINACVEKIGALATADKIKETLHLPYEEFNQILAKFCTLSANGSLLLHFSHHDVKTKTLIKLESLLSLELMVSEIFRNSIKAGATKISVHVSDTQELIKIFFRDNGTGISLHKRDLMAIPNPTRGKGGEGTKLLENLAFNSGGAISWHTVGLSGTIVKLLLQKHLAEV